MIIYAAVGVWIKWLRWIFVYYQKKVLKLTNLIINNLMMFYSARILKIFLSFLEDKTKTLKINFPKSSVQNENDQAHKKLK